MCLSIIHSRLSKPISTILGATILYMHLFALLAYFIVLKCWKLFSWYVYAFFAVMAFVATIVLLMAVLPSISIYETSNCVVSQWKIMARKGFWQKISQYPKLVDEGVIKRKIIALKPLNFTFSSFLKPTIHTKVTYFEAIVRNVIDVLLLIDV